MLLEPAHGRSLGCSPSARGPEAERHPEKPRLSRKSALALVVLPAALAVLGVVAAACPLAAEPQSRAFRQSFTVGSGAAQLRLDNLAGRVELVAGQGGEVVVEATVHAEGSSAEETRQLLEGMKWVRARDSKGREEWALSYPVGRYHSFHYPRGYQGHEKEESSFWQLFVDGHSSTTYRGERVRIYSSRRSAAPTLYADLRISIPPGANVAVRDVVGAVRGGSLEGSLTVDTGSGSIDLASFAGRLELDTGSGDVHVGSCRGETSIDTGSGDVVVRQLVGNGKVDTGSGDVKVEKVAAGKLSIDTGSGEVTVRDGMVGQLKADTGSGEVRVLGVEIEELVADTGSGEVTIRTSLANARRLTVKTGSGDVRITAGAAASFDVSSDQGSGELRVGYPDATLRRAGRKVVGAHRGDGRTLIRVATGSGDCMIGPHGTGD